MEQFWGPIIFGIIVFIIVISLIRSVLKALFISVIAVILFRFAWIYSADELFNKFKLNEIMNEQKAEEFYETYDEYTKRRNQDALIDANKIDDKIKDSEAEIRNRLDEKVKEHRKNKDN